jgi:hypothetical protein
LSLDLVLSSPQIQRSVSPEEELRERVIRTIEALKESSTSFDIAHETYTQQYGKDSIVVNRPTNIGETIDPVALVLGRNCVIYFHDSKKVLSGSLGSLELKAGVAYIIGRREPQDSRLVVWSPIGGTETDLSEYNSGASTIPSRIHGAIMVVNEAETYFSDLGSSAGTVIVGESRKEGAFVKIYDPGSTKSPTIKFERVSTSRRN